MRVRECSWPPSLVVEWLCRQLEQRDIPGTLYAHTVLSLLHSHYCLHSAAHYTTSAPEQGLVVVGTPPATALLEHCALLLQQHHTHQCSAGRHAHDNTHGAAIDSTSPAATLKQHDRSSRLLLGGANLLKGALLLEEQEEIILGQNLHPDADLPLVFRNPKTPNKTKSQHNQACCCESGSRRARKRHRKLLQQELSLECFSPERLQKLTALQCLLSASDQERSDLEALLEELCRRLKASACLADADGAPPPSPPPPPPPVTRITDKLAHPKQGSGAAFGVQPSEQSAGDAQRYFAAFPALLCDSESGPDTSSVADCAWGCKETCGHSDDTTTHGNDTLTHGDDTPTHGDDTSTHGDGTHTHTHGDDTHSHGDDPPTHSDDTYTHDIPTHGDNTPTHLHAATGNKAVTKRIQENNYQLATSEEAVTSRCDPKCTEITPATSNEVISKPSSNVCFKNNSVFQNASCFIVDQDPLNVSYNKYDFSCSEKQKTNDNCYSERSKKIQNGEINNSLDDCVIAVDTSTALPLSGLKGKSVQESSIGTSTVFGQADDENLVHFPSTKAFESLETSIDSQLIELAGDDKAKNLAIVTGNAPELSNIPPSDEPIPLKNQLAAQQPLCKHLCTSDPIHSDLDLLLTTSGAPVETLVSDTFTDTLKLYSFGPNTAAKNSVSPTHPLLDVKSLTTSAPDINQTSALDLSDLRNPGDPGTLHKGHIGYSIWDSAYSPLVKLAVQTQSSYFSGEKNVPDGNALSERNDLNLAKLIYGCAENLNDNSVALRNTKPLQNFHISPSDLKRTQISPYITKHISPSDLKSKRKLPFSKNESLALNAEDEDLMTCRFQDRIVSEQVESQLTGHGMERSDHMSVISGQRGLMSQPRYQSYAAHQISFGDIEPPMQSDLEQQLNSHHYTGGNGSHNVPDDLNLLCSIEAEADRRFAADNFIVTATSPGANPGENEGNDPSSSATVCPEMMFHQPNTALPAAEPPPRPSRVDSGAAASGGGGDSFNQGYGCEYDGRQGGLDGPIETDYVGVISSRESSEDREDYDEALADDEDDEGDQRHGVMRRHQPDEDKRRRLSEKRRSRLVSLTGGHKHQQDGQLNSFAAYRGEVPQPSPPPSSMFSSQEQMQLKQEVIVDHQRNFFERRQQEFQQQQQLEHLEQMNFFQQQLLLIEQQHAFTSASESSNLVEANSQSGNPLYRPPCELSGIVLALEHNIWHQNIYDLDRNVEHTLAHYLDLLNQPNSRPSLLAPSDPFSPITENNRTSSNAISEYLLKSLMESPGFGPQKADGGEESSVRRSVSNDHQDAWVDLNANNLSSSAVSAPLATLINPHPQNNEFNRPVIVGDCDYDDEEKSLCKTFQSLGLERIWDSDAATNANDEYALARQQMLQAGSLYQLSDKFMHQSQQSHQQKLHPKNNSEARVWPTALQSHAQLQRSDPGHTSASIVNPTFLRLSSGPSEAEKDLSCYALSNLQLFSSSVCGDVPPQQPLQKRAVQYDQAVPASHTDGSELRGASVGSSASGPGGVQVVLHRSSLSNFSKVVPRKTNVQGQDYQKPMSVADALISVEENLLTSPRTHFRPIKLHDETTVNGTLTNFTATLPHVPLSLPYQRSNSGTLYLEKDAIDGSPKKYMIYKDPADKTTEHRPLYMPNQESSLVPKFKVVKNEKFCQTDGTNHDLGVVSSSEAASSSYRTPSPESDDDYDVFAFQKNDLTSNGAFQKNDLPSYGVYQRNDTPPHGAFQRNDQASHGASKENDQAFHGACQINDDASHGASEKADQAYRGSFQKNEHAPHGVFLRNDQSSNDIFRNNQASHDPFQKIDQLSLSDFHNNDQASDDLSFRGCWTDIPMKEGAWKTFNLNTHLMNNESKWVTKTGDTEQSDRVRASPPNDRETSDPRGFDAYEQVQQRINKANGASPCKSFCRNLLGPVLDSDASTCVAQLVGEGSSGQSGRKERVIDTPSARAIWSSDPSTSVSGQQCHQAVIAAQHIDPAIKALWANSPEDKFKLAAAAETVYFNDNNSCGNEESAALPAWTMKSRVSGGIKQQIPTEWLAEQSVLYTAEEGVLGGVDKESCGIKFPEHLTNYYPQDEAWSSGDDCAPSNSDDFVRGIWNKATDPWNSNEDGWQKESLKKMKSVENWKDKSGPNLNQNDEIWKKDGSSDWGNQDDRYHGGNTAKWCEGENGGYSQIRGGPLDGLQEYCEVRWSQADSASKMTASGGGGVWPVLSTKDHLDDLALLVEAQNWEKAVNLSTSDCTVSGNNQQQLPPNKAESLLQEDLEELDPGWQLQEGFVWDPHTGNTPRKMPPQQQQQSGTETDDFDDTASQSSGGSSSSSEVVMVQTEDGETLAVQVEYLDEELYDRIFGAPDLQMAGSLPDLPNNQAGLKVLRERWLPPWRRPCTFFMEGSCRRKHCKFSHDLSSITCRFWQDGSCLKGSECPFLHGYPVLPRRRNRSEGDSRDGNRLGGTAVDGQQGSVLSQQLRREGGKQRHRLSSFELTSETDFPSLGAAPDTKESERSGASGPVASGGGHQSSGGANSSGAFQPSAQCTPQQPQQIRKKTKYTPITAAILQASIADQGGSGTKGRRRRHTHSAQRSRLPDSHHHHASAAVSINAAAAATAQPSSLADNSCLSTTGTLIIKPGTTLIGTASNGQSTTFGASVLPVKAKVRRNRSKVKEPARSLIAGASVLSPVDGVVSRVHGDGTLSDY